jgi:hypothetical protein
MKCNYCDSTHKTKAEYHAHLNKKHTRCFYCSSVFNNDQFDDDYAICGKCREKESEEWRDPWWFKEPTPPPVQQIKLHGCELCGNLTCRGTCFK